MTVRSSILSFALRGVLFLAPVVAWQSVSLAAYLSDARFPYLVLQRHQEAKLTPDETVETLLVGDSSLGNAIDADQFSRETGSRAVSLALTGLYGYAGSENMLARAAEVFPNLRTVVIVNTPDMLARERSSRGALLTLGSAGRLTRLDRADALDAIAEAFRLLFSREVAGYLLDRPPPAPPDVLDGDYIRQAERRATPRLATRTPADVRPEKLRALARLAQTADDLGLDAVYVHGPLWEDQLLADGAYLDAAERAIASTGLTFVPGFEPIPTDRLGDSADHVAREDRAAVTARYAARLAPYLR